MEENNKRIAKNTMYLYFRMLIFLFVGLFTARVTINALGVKDYGLLNVVGGVMGFLGYFSTLLSQGTSRFLTVGLGKGNIDELKKIFSACNTIHIGLAVFTLILGETIGLWFVNNKLIIDPERLWAANWVYQLSLSSAVLSITQTPFMAAVIAHEKMSTFAFMSILGVVVKLIAAVLLLYVDTDKLVMYSSFYFGIGLLTFMMYRIYCMKQFEECNMHLRWDKKLYSEIWNYIGWNSVGTFAFMANNQGVTVILNMFFNTTVNAARGIAGTVSSHINGFVVNFQTAIRPQIIKLYARNEFDKMNALICNNAKYSSYLLVLTGLPVAIETEFLINLWLAHVPDYVVPFVRLTLIKMFFRAVDFPIGDGIHAFGKMKLPNLTSSLVYLSVLPLTYLFLLSGASPVMAYIVTCIAYPLALLFDLWILNKYSLFNVMYYIKNVIIKSCVIILLSSTVPFIISETFETGWLRFILSVTSCELFSAISIWYIGMDMVMREKIIDKILCKYKRAKNSLKSFYIH